MKTSDSKTKKRPQREGTGAARKVTGSTTVAEVEASPANRFAQVRSILVPTDFSTSAAYALGYTANLARQSGAKLTVLHVVEPAGLPDFTATYLS